MKKAYPIILILTIVSSAFLTTVIEYFLFNLFELSSSLNLWIITLFVNIFIMAGVCFLALYLVRKLASNKSNNK